jgi:hypothetical protein
MVPRMVAGYGGSVKIPTGVPAGAVTIAGPHRIEEESWVVDCFVGWSSSA